MKWWLELLFLLLGWIFFFLFINEKTRYISGQIVEKTFKILTSFPIFLLSICLSYDAWHNIRTSEIDTKNKIIIFFYILVVHIVWFNAKSKEDDNSPPSD